MKTEIIEHNGKTYKVIEIIKEFQTIKNGNKEFRIYKWESKPFKDFIMPKGFDWCPYFEFVELINKGEVFEEYPVFYYVKNQFIKNIKFGYELSRVYFGRDGDVDAGYDDLQDSDDYGRVVLMRCGK